MLYYTPTLDQECPPWVYATWSIGLFLYQTLDALDGAQAYVDQNSQLTIRRRTKQGSPLGELFDHGVDAINTVLEVLLFAAAAGLGQGWKTILVLFGCTFTFYVQTWDEFHTKQLTLGLISGPVEGIATLVLMYAATAVKGMHYWQQPMLETLLGFEPTFIPKSIRNLAFNEWWIVYGAAVLAFNTYSSAINVMKARRERNLDPGFALLGLLPVVIIWTLIASYLYLHEDILHHHLVPFTFYVGLVNALSVGKMIIRHLIQGKFPINNVLVLPLIFGVLDSLGPLLQSSIGVGWPSVLGPEYQVAFVFMCLGFGIGIYGSFVVDVIRAITQYLDIWCLTIKYPQTEGEQKRK